MNNKEIIKEIKERIKTTEDAWELQRLNDQITDLVIELNYLTRKVQEKQEQVC